MPAIAGFQAPGVIGALELAVAQATKHLHFAHAQHDQVGVAVSVDIDRVRTNGIRQFQSRALFEQFDRAALRAFVAVKLGAIDTRRHVNLGQTVAITVEGGDTAADHEFALAFKPALETRRVGFFDETRDGRLRRLAGRWRAGRSRPRHGLALRLQGKSAQQCQQQAEPGRHPSARGLNQAASL